MMTTEQPPEYQPRVVDAELDELTKQLAAVSIAGAKAVGKTRTAQRRALTTRRLDDANELAVARADPRRLLEGARPVLIDEWQRLPETWDLVRRAVDEGARPGSYLLTGSAVPEQRGTHSGAARIVSVRMRPLSLLERGLATPSVKLSKLAEGGRPKIEGQCECDLNVYVEEILASGFPGLRGLKGRAVRAQLDGYVDRVVDRDFPELGHAVRNPETLKRWMTAYAAASSTTASFEKIRDAATSDQKEKPSKTATIPYRDILERIWFLDPVPAWLPTQSHLRRLAAPPKHQLVDPALAASLLGVDADALLDGRDVGPPIPRDGTLLGALFESLVVLSVRVYAQAIEATVKHLRTAAGEHEVDMIVERRDGRVIAIEVKLTRTPSDDDVRDLVWLQQRIGDRLLDAVVISSGEDAYRRSDGIAVVPAALLAN